MSFSYRCQPEREREGCEGDWHGPQLAAVGGAEQVKGFPNVHFNASACARRAAALGAALRDAVGSAHDEQLWQILCQG